MKWIAAAILAGSVIIAATIATRPSPEPQQPQAPTVVTVPAPEPYEPGRPSIFGD